MKFRTEPRTLADAAAFVGKALPARPAVPVLAGVVLDAYDDAVSLSTFNYDASARTSVDATVGEPGRVLVSARLLADIAKALPAKPVDVSHDGSWVHIVCGTARFRLPTMPIEDYPQLPTVPEVTGSLSGELFAQAVAQVAASAGRDDSLPMLTGIRLEAAGSRLTLAATDRFRLSVRELDWQPTDPDVQLEAVLPAKALVDTAKAVASATRVDLALSGGMVAVTADRRQTTARLLDAQFPRFRQLIPSEHTATAVVRVDELAGAAKRVNLVSDRVAQVILTFGHDTLSITAGGDENGRAEEDVPCTLTGEPLAIAFNPAYLLDALSTMPTPRVSLAFTGPNRPGVVRPIADDDLTATGDLLALLMPVRLPER